MHVPTGLARGIIDSGAPLAARWYADEDCTDRFAADAMRAVEAALDSDVDRIAWPDGQGRVDGIDGVLVGHREIATPSVVLHAAAVGLLLECGFFPTALCVRRHLLVLRRLLQRANAHDPALRDDGWALRTRHVAWVLACLAEMPHDDANAAQLTDGAEAAVQLHHDVLQTAYRYLIAWPGNSADKDDPAAWVGRRSSEAAWTEWYGGVRSANLLNSLYTLLGLCRAERHGFGSTILGGTPFETVDDDVQALLLDRLQINNTSGGIEVLLRGDWSEPWAHAPLPAGIIALISLVLVEYAAMLYEHGRSPRTLRRAALAQLLSQRLAHRLAATVDEWWCHADVFFRTGAEGHWFIPSYSMGARSLLETGAIAASASVVAHPFTTIESTARTTFLAGVSIGTWADPTRTDTMRAEMTSRLDGPDGEEVRAHGHCVVELPRTGPHDRVTVAGLHAVVLAYSALRRAAGRLDPRDLLHPPSRRPARGARPRPYNGRSPFTRVELAGNGGNWRLQLVFPRVEPIWKEGCALGDAAAAVLLALADAAPLSLTTSELAARVGELGWPREASAKAVASVIESINRRFSMALIVGRARDDGLHAYCIEGEIDVTPQNLRPPQPRS